jgi:flagellar motility protein MotE (MotC chaperone)
LRKEIDDLVTHNESLQRQLDRSRKTCTEKERTLKEQLYEVQKENRELKSDLRRVEIDARVANRNNEDLKGRIERNR